MQSTMNRSPLWASSITNDLQQLTDRELADELASLRHDLDGAGRFGLVAARGLRAHCQNRLGLLSDEYLRRTTRPTILPRPIRHPAIVERPAAA